QVALFIDFENLIYGLNQEHGEQRAYELFSIQPLLELARAHGQLCEIRAYADWRMKAVNRFQSQLYQVGTELVHVLGRFGKNSVDMKMAVDLTELAVSRTRPELIILVSGDRDFIHVLRCLKRYGRQIIGVAPRGAWSEDLRLLCESFHHYESLAPVEKDEDPQRESAHRELAEWLEAALREAPAGLSGTQLRRRLEALSERRFEPRYYGYLKLRHLLADFPEIVRVTVPTEGDLQLSLASAPAPSPDTALDERSVALLQPLSAYRYEREREERETLLKSIYEVLSAERTFTWHEISERLGEHLSLSRTALAKYHAILWQSRCFELSETTTEAEAQRPLKQRPMRLTPSIQSFQDLKYLYERSILLKVQQHLDKLGLSPVTASDARVVFGLAAEEGEEKEAELRELLEALTQSKMEQEDKQAQTEESPTRSEER
ncbi:MAG: NYN domain-containing protein, partial [Myxococcota bacterium]|nr:NYN domain-containing protein [Myxococcota bacterium]